MKLSPEFWWPPAVVAASGVGTAVLVALGVWAVSDIEESLDEIDADIELWDVLDACEDEDARATLRGDEVAEFDMKCAEAWSVLWRQVQEDKRGEAERVLGYGERGE